MRKTVLVPHLKCRMPLRPHVWIRFLLKHKCVPFLTSLSLQPSIKSVFYEIFVLPYICDSVELLSETSVLHLAERYVLGNAML